MNPEQPLLILSISSKFSGNGIYFYNNLFVENNVNAIYRSCPVKNLKFFRSAIDFIGVYGASIASPFKLDVIDKIDSLTDIANATRSVNCIKRVDGKIEGHNSDVIGLINIFKEQTEKLVKHPTFLIYGTGGVVHSIIYALRVVFKEPIIFISGRNSDKVKVIAEQFSVKAIDDPMKLEVSLWINATPASVDKPYDILKICSRTNIVFDLNPISEKYCFELEIRKRGQKFIRGFDFYMKQFVEQYYFFINERISEQQIRELALKRA